MNDSAQLLRELRIDRREPAPTAASPLRWIIVALALVGVAAGLWWYAGGTGAPLVQTATARAITAASGAGPASVLDASGYVTARRQATVSSKVTGKVTEVLVEEGMRVEE